MSRTLNQWLDVILVQHKSAILLGLERIQPIAKRLSLTSFDCPVVVIAGTNGKGSSACLLENIYLNCGYNVGVYSSPHLHRFNERLRVNAEPVSDMILIDAFENINHFANEDLSFFEFTTLSCLFILNQLQLDVILLEVGLGGRLDAVNVVDADVAMITSIGLDHQDWLGATREKIAIEKCGVFRGGMDAVCTESDPPVTIANQARLLGTKLHQLGQDFVYKPEGETWSYEGSQSMHGLPIPALRLDHAASAIRVSELLGARLPVNRTAFQRGLRKASLPGRFECWKSPVELIFDVAHNPQASAYLAERLLEVYKDKTIIAVIAMLGDKSIKETLKPLLSVCCLWYTADLDVPRGAKNGEVIAALKHLGVSCCGNHVSVESAMENAIVDSQQYRDSVVVVFGSFNTVSQAQQYCMKRRK